jgi:hypothetical protein
VKTAHEWIAELGTIQAQSCPAEPLVAVVPEEILAIQLDAWRAAIERAALRIERSAGVNSAPFAEAIRALPEPGSE